MRVFCTYLLLTCFFSLAAQERKLNKRSPHRASIYSALFPGAGQVYNKKYWKTPIILAGIGSAFYLASDNQKKYSIYRDALLLRRSGEVDAYNNVYTENQLITIMGYYERNKEVSIIMGVLVYLLNIVDASVDAHLFDFDVSENLTLHSSPMFIHSISGKHPALSVQMNF